MSVPMYFIVGFDASASMFFPFYGFTIAAASCATGLGYLVSCIARRVDIAPILGIVFMLPFILFGGMFLNTSTTPSYFKWLEALSPVMYVFHCLMRVFWSEVATIECRPGQFCVASKGSDVLKIHSITSAAGSQRDAILYMLAINIGFRVLGAIVLWMRVDGNKAAKKAALPATEGAAQPQLK